MNLTDQRKRCLQFQIIELDTELKNVCRLYPKTKPTVDVARDLLGRFSHSISGVADVREYCDNLANHATRRMEEATS
jgi:hypothetical protein